MNKKILILGSDSAIGNAFEKYLREGSNYGVIPFYLEKEKYYEYGYDLFYNLLEKYQPDYVVNFLGLFLGDTKDIFHVNLKLPMELLEASKDLSFNGRIMLIGSAAEYGLNSNYSENGIFNPSSFYGMSKYLQYKLMQFYSQKEDLDIVYARIFNVMSAYISSYLFPGMFAKEIIQYMRKQTDRIQLGNVDVIRDYITMSTLTMLLKEVMEKGISGEDYNVCSSYELYLKRFVFNIIDKFNIKRDALSLDSDMESAGRSGNIVIGNNNKLISLLNKNCFAEEYGSIIETEFLEEIRNILIK